MKSEIVKFLQATGNYHDLDSKETFFEEIGKLIPLIQEELDELRESHKLRYVNGVLDDTGDIQVYVHQLESLLERIGCNVTGAKQDITDNNSLKYTTSKKLAERWLAEHYSQARMFKQDNPFYISENKYDGETFYCLKRKDTHKVGKWCGFPKPALEQYVPKEYGGSL